MIVFLIILGLLAIPAIMALIVPRVFVVKHDYDNVHLRISFIGIFIFFTRLLLGIFSEKAQLVIIRLVGFAVLAGFGYICFSVAQSGQLKTLIASELGNSPPPAETILEDQENDPDMQNPEYQRRLREEGPAYTQRVIDLISAERNDWILVSEEPMTLVVINKKTLIEDHYNFKWAFFNDTSAEERAQIILETADATHALGLAEMRKRGTYEEHFAKNQEKYAAYLKPAATLADADELIRLASAAWQQGDFQGSLDKAQEAWKIRSEHLGPAHPSTVEVESMIRAAQQQVAGN